MRDFAQQSDLGLFSCPVLSVPVQRARSICASHRWNHQRNTVVAYVAAEPRVRLLLRHLCRGGEPASIVVVGVVVVVVVVVDVGR